MSQNTTIATLDDLFAAMRNHDPRTMDGEEWSADLPTFGGEEPTDTYQVWSWDAERLIVGSCSDELRIVSRDEW